MTDLMEHTIDTGNANPIKQAPRRLPTRKRHVVDEQLTDLLEAGRIEESVSPWSSPIVLLTKKMGHIGYALTTKNQTQSPSKMLSLYRELMTFLNHLMALPGLPVWTWFQVTGKYQLQRQTDRKLLLLLIGDSSSGPVCPLGSPMGQLPSNVS